jgi:hypothetical protein
MNFFSNFEGKFFLIQKKKENKIQRNLLKEPISFKFYFRKEFQISKFFEC